MEDGSDPAESEVTNDVRYQEFNEVTPDGSGENGSVRGYFFFMKLCAQRGAFLLRVGIWLTGVPGGDTIIALRLRRGVPCRLRERFFPVSAETS